MRNHENIPSELTKRPKNFLKALGIGFISAALSLNPTNLAEGSFIVGSKNTSDSKTENIFQNEDFADSQINEIKNIILNKEYGKITSNPYLAYCLYYSQRFLDKISDPKNQTDISKKIIGQVAPLITPKFREEAIEFLRKKTNELEVSENKKISTDEALPLELIDYGKGIGHSDAIDLFTEEGSNIHSMTSGIVLVADNGWIEGDENSTSSIEGGNTVIIFNPLTNEFYRYAHLDETSVKPGKLVVAGEKLGTVGHSGKNASKPGRGNHLHLEVNDSDSERINKSIPAIALKKMLNNLQENA